MEFPSKRSNYTLLSQFPEEEEKEEDQQQSKFSGGGGGGGGGGKSDRGFFDWDGDNRLQQGGGRVTTNLNLFPSIGLQRQSSGSSSFGESSLSGEYHVPMMMLNDSEMFLGHLHEDGFKTGDGGELRLKGIEASVSSSSKSWAQQTEECYQLQQALALRLSSDATCADDLTFLDDSVTRSSPASSQALSHRFWVNGCLSYFDKVPDGFYLIHGMDPYVWTVCTDVQENGRVPSIESLKAVIPSDDSSIEVVLFDKSSDSGLEELVSRVISLSHSCISTEEVVDQLAKCVCNRMGGAGSTNEGGLFSRWKDCCKVLKDRLDSIVLPLGSLSVGLCRHRALLFKVLADAIDLPCRIAKGCKYCRRDDASSALVRFGLDREYLVDLIEKPGCLCEPDSLYNGPSSISMSSPLRFLNFKPVETNENFRSWAKQYFLDCQSLALMFGDTPSGIPVDQKASTDPLLPKHFDKKQTDMDNLVPISGINDSVLLVPQIGSELNEHDEDRMLQNLCTPQNVASPIHLVKDSIPLKQLPSCGHKDVQSVLALSNSRINMDRDLRFIEGVQVVPNKSITEFSLDVEGLEIPWSDLVIKEKIGAGSFGTVHRADWRGSDVAVKILMEQDFHVVHVKDFLREVALMKRLRHPNIVLFMGAVTQPPNLSIVTEYLSRGSLFRLLHKSGARALLDERRRLSMAYDVADGMNYLHRRNPPIVHRDLKSPNLLVDKKFTVKAITLLTNDRVSNCGAGCFPTDLCCPAILVCDFGLSRLKENTFLSSKTGAGTPEWMAPEVLRDEPSNEKSDVYSFGVILWELVMLQLPWSTLNPAQVVAAVAFNNRRLEIPSNVNPQVAELIEACWANDPWTRPSFFDIMESLKPLIRPPTLPLHADIPQSPI